MIEAQFKDAFDKPPSQVAYAPGRVNLIGEHIDYNGGVVLPTALPIGLYVGLRPRADQSIQIASARFAGVESRRLGDPKRNDWADYAAGAVAHATEIGLLDGGADLFIESTIPDGAGLSSSAALIVAVLKAARALADRDMSDEEIAINAKRVENDYIGMPCGIMDQMAVAVALTGQAIKLDTKSLDYRVIDLPTDVHMAVVHSGQHRKLSDGRYGARKEECDLAKAHFKTPDLCLLGLEDLKSADLSPTLIRRVRHCITEHRRTIEAAAALEAGDMATFSAMMSESHLSMRDDFEMSTPQIDALVNIATDLGALGARLTGGGFGGCIVAAVPVPMLEAWKTALAKKAPTARYIC